MGKLILAFGMVAALSACAGGGQGLRDLRQNGGGPDEFSVQPSRQLVMPDSVGTLPTPTPGGANRADATPNADAVAVLGGNPNGLVPSQQGVPQRDQALIAAVGRNGVDPTIRQTLADEDAAFRGRRSRLSLFGGRDRYFQAYARQALDAYAELQRFRNAGVTTPTAPPQ